MRIKAKISRIPNLLRLNKIFFYCHLRAVYMFIFWYSISHRHFIVNISVRHHQRNLIFPATQYKSRCPKSDRNQAAVFVVNERNGFAIL